jgi:hypothetical protein
MNICNVRELKRLAGKLIKLVNGNLPVFADNAAAILGGISVGDQYRTVTGEVRVVV